MVEFNISSCKISNLISLGEFIKKAKKLEVVYAEDCGFSFDKEDLSSFFECCKSSKLLKVSLIKNDLVDNLHPF